MDEYIPENNLVVLFFLMVLTLGLYYFWWLARTSKIFGEDPVINILLAIFTFGMWGVYLNLRFMQKSELLNGREVKWYIILFIFILPIMIQNNLNERYFPSR
jgi:hypothetical protein